MTWLDEILWGRFCVMWRLVGNEMLQSPFEHTLDRLRRIWPCRYCSKPIIVARWADQTDNNRACDRCTADDEGDTTEMQIRKTGIAAARELRHPKPKIFFLS